MYVDDIKLAGKKQTLDPKWKILLKDIHLGEPTSFLDHVYLGCTQRVCATSKDIVDNYRNMFECQISAWISNLTMVYFNNILDLLGRWHCPSTIIWMFCTIAAFCVDDLVVIVSFLLPDFLDFFSATATPSQRELICHHFHQHGCSTRACMGPIPGCFASWVLESRPWLSSSRPSVPCSSAHLLADCFSDPRSPIAGCDRVHVSCSWHTLQTSSFALLF